jgi:hypothetical protein
VHRVNRTSGSIKVEMEGVTVLIIRGADAKTIAAALHALKGRRVIGFSGEQRQVPA